MSFSFSNPDVDPLSLSERVRKLESQLGPGGSGGGGGSGFSFPDFDQFPDNEVSKTPSGLVLKYSVDNLNTITNITDLDGVAFKLIVCWQIIPNSAATYQYAIVRIHMTTGTGDISSEQAASFQPNIANQNLWEDTFIQNPLQNAPSSHYMGLITCPNIFASSNDVDTYPRTVNFGGLRIQMNTREPWVLRTSRRTMPSFTSPILPSYSYGASIVTMGQSSAVMTLDVGSSNVNVGYSPYFTVKQLQDMPAIAQTMYPKSWLS